jgi:predicted RNase H-like HicB family nuclease
MKVQVVIQPEAEGGYSAFVPGFPGCTSCGDTLEETLANIREAFEGVLEVMQAQDPEAGADLANPGTALIRETIEV